MQPSSTKQSVVEQMLWTSEWKVCCSSKIRVSFTPVLFHDHLIISLQQRAFDIGGRELLAVLNLPMALEVAEQPFHLTLNQTCGFHHTPMAQLRGQIRNWRLPFSVSCPLIYMESTWSQQLTWIEYADTFVMSTSRPLLGISHLYFQKHCQNIWLTMKYISLGSESKKT